MIESLKDLDEKMENKLNLMYGNYIDVIEHMKEKHGINGVYANTDYSPYAKVLFRPVYFRWLKIIGIYAAFPISITLFSNLLKWNSLR